MTKNLKLLHELSKLEYTHMNPTLNRIKKISELLDNPHKKIKNIIHITGTNGKGSVAYFISAMLMKNNFTVGTYTSPHIFDFKERIMVNFKKIKNHEIESYLDKLLKVVPRLFEKFTYFEIMTAIMFCYFSEKNLDYAVIEVGIDGKYDATNVVVPEISIITSISYDHTEILGNRIEDIAYENSGVIKYNKPTIIGEIPKKAKEVIFNIAKKKKSKLYMLGKDFRIKFKGQENAFQVFSYEGLKWNLPNLKIPSLAFYQLKNIALAIFAVELLNESQIKSERIKEALLEYGSICGRFNVFKTNKRVVIIDAAHNEDGCRNLVKSMKRFFSKVNLLLPCSSKHEKITLIMGVLKDKDYAKMCEILSAIAKRVLVIKPRSIRALEPQKLARIWKKMSNVDVKSYNNFISAWENLNKNDKFVCITGSFYLLSDVYKYLNLYKRAVKIPLFLPSHLLDLSS